MDNRCYPSVRSKTQRRIIGPPVAPIMPTYVNRLNNKVTRTVANAGID
jgi:hypothetical protein